MNKKNVTFSFLLILFILGKTSTSIANDDHTISGRYKYEEKGEQLIDGSQSSINWIFDFNKKGEVVVKISSWHIPFTCAGIYQITNAKNIFKLNILKDKKYECDIEPPQFVLKRTSNGSIKIKSRLFLFDGWRNLKKLN